MSMRNSFTLMLVLVAFLVGFGIAFAMLRWDRVGLLTPVLKSPSWPNTKFMNPPEAIPAAISGDVDDANSSNVVRIGLCEDKLVDEEARAVAKALGTLFHEGGKKVVYVITKHGVVPEAQPSPDILICLGYFYPESVWKSRQEQYQTAPVLPPQFENHLVNDVFYPAGMKQLIHKKGRSFLVAFSGEPWDGGDCRYDLLFVTRNDYGFQGCAVAYFPVLSTTFSKRKGIIDHHLVVDALDVDKEITPDLAKRDFMILVITNCYKPEYSGVDALLRSSFFDFVSANYKQVHGLGHCRRTPGLKALPDFIEQGPKFDAVTERYHDYKFVITFENQRYPGYVTEKILNAVLARSIPIYWGAEHLDKMLNPARYIHCDIDTRLLQRSPLTQRWNSSPRHDTDPVIKELIELLKANFTKCLQEIKRLDQDDKAYLKMLRQPILLNNRVEGSIFDRRLQAKQVFEALRMQQSYLVADMPTP